MKSNADLKAEAGRLGDKLLPSKVFVLKEGEIEDYVGLSKSSKGDYVLAASEISAGTRPLLHEPELLKVFKTFASQA